MIAELINRINPKDIIIAVIGGFLICGTILLAIYLIGYWYGIY